MRTFLTLLCFCLLASFASFALAQTPDGDPPSVEVVCDAEVGAAFGLCNAYCEAMDCDCPTLENPECMPNANPTACGRVKGRYQQVTGNENLPCDDVEPPAPVCGNGILEAGEACDDGNLADGDGCDSMCMIETAACPCGVDENFLTNIDWSDDPSDFGASNAGFLWDSGATGGLSSPSCTDSGADPTVWAEGSGLLMSAMDVDGSTSLVSVEATATGYQCAASNAVAGTFGTLDINVAEAAACYVDLKEGC